MIILLTILIIIAFIVGIVTEYEYDIISALSFTGIIVLGIIDVIAIICCVCSYTEGITSKEKIEMYQEENKQIEEQIDTLVKQYMKYEQETYKEFANESSITLVTLFPDLKSDELVKTQLNIYVENTNKIKELKESQINLKIGKWLLYFG